MAEPTQQKQQTAPEAGSNPDEEDPHEVLKQQWQEAVRATRPKDAAQGVTSGIATAAAGIATGVVGLFAAPIVGAKQEGASGFAKGLAKGVAGVVVLPVAGVVGGVVQVGRGIANQSEAMKEKKKGRIWNKDTHEWEDPPGTDIQEYDADLAAQQLGIQPDVDYYTLLEVSRDVDAATLKRQYYMLARKWHPDKNPGDLEATERFQQLGQAYQVLSNPDLRARYDKHGAAGLDVEFVDPSMFFGMLFGSELFEPVVGEFMIVSATSKGRELTEKEINYIQEARIGKLLAQLKSRLAPFIAGEVEAFREVQTINAQQLAAASFGGVMLQAVGRVYQTEADIHQGNPLLGGLTKLRRAGDNIKSQVQAAKAAMDLVQHQVKLEAADTQLKEHAQALQEKHGSSGDLPELEKLQLASLMQQRHELELTGVGLTLQAVWAANVLDIQKTLHQVCKRLLREPGIAKAEAKAYLRRAKAAARYLAVRQRTKKRHRNRSRRSARVEVAAATPPMDSAVAVPDAAPAAKTVTPAAASSATFVGAQPAPVINPAVVPTPPAPLAAATKATQGSSGAPLPLARAPPPPPPLPPSGTDTAAPSRTQPEATCQQAPAPPVPISAARVPPPPPLPPRAAVRSPPGPPPPPPPAAGGAKGPPVPPGGPPVLGSNTAAAPAFGGKHKVVTMTVHHQRPDKQLLEGSLWMLPATRAAYWRGVEKMAAPNSPWAAELDRDYARKETSTKLKSKPKGSEQKLVSGRLQELAAWHLRAE
eukprot:gene4774-5024_t